MAKAQFSPEERARRSAFAKARWQDPEWSARVRLKISVAAKAAGTGRWSKGCKLSEATKEKISKSHTGAGNPGWKGDCAKYNAIIGWIVRNAGRADDRPCEKCGVTKERRRIYWTSTERPAKRDVEKWRRLCGICNRAFRIETFGDRFGWRGTKQRDGKGRLPVTICKRIRGLAAYEKWREFILSRDHNTCSCGSRSSVHVDHYPKSLARIVRQYHILSTSDALDCIELWDVNNGRAICEDCHKKTDTWAGRGLKRNE
jgi:NUMOD3 motif